MLLMYFKIAKCNEVNMFTLVFYLDIFFCFGGGFYAVFLICKILILAARTYCGFQIKRAHRQKVLKHHPDKRKHAGEEVRPPS